MSAKKSKNLAVTRKKGKKAPRVTREKLTPLMIDFCAEYALNGYKNATQAYLRACDDTSEYNAAAISASRYLQSPKIRSRLKRMKAKTDVSPFAVTLEEIQRELYETVQVTMGRKPAYRVNRSKNGIEGDILLRNFEGLAAISALDKLAKLAGGYDKGQAASGLKVNINIDIGGQAAGPHPTVSTVVPSDKTDDKVVSDQ
ncbi:MAG: hypothetical protein BMS9Abin33_1244 [Gammaproteobacteria bacterium]|nr:MAG: hypothetical protein BMS9Abin33_1244 [Gammaproteobacteria bacterium]